MNLPANVQNAFRQGRNLDNGDGSLAGVANNYTFNVTGTVLGGAHTTDQLNLFNIPTDIIAVGQTLCPVTTQVGSTGYSVAQIASHFGTHPAPLVNWNIPASTNQSVLASMTYFTVRRSPSGKFSQEEIPVATLLTSGQYQNDRVQYSASGQIIFDGETFARFNWSAQNPVVTLLISFSFGPEVDLRSMARTAAPVVIAGG